jgi:hypothetical protein
MPAATEVQSIPAAKVPGQRPRAEIGRALWDCFFDYQRIYSTRGWQQPPVDENGYRQIRRRRQ